MSDVMQKEVDRQDRVIQNLRDEIERLQTEVDRLKQALTVEGDALLNAQYWSERWKKENKILKRFRSAALAYEDSGEWTDYETYAAALKAATEQEGET